VAAYRGFLATATATAMLGGLGIFMLFRQASRTAQRVVVSDSGIEGRGLFRKAAGHLAWQEIAEIQRIRKPTMQGPIVFIRLRSKDQETEIVFHQKLPGFGRLCDVVRENAPFARATTPTFIERLQWL
jgi:hypothetical protein